MNEVEYDSDLWWLIVEIYAAWVVLILFILLEVTS